MGEVGTSRAGAKRVAVSTERIAAALARSRGLLAPAAKSLGIPRSTLQSKIDASEALQAVMKECRETLIDQAESVLYRNAIEDEDRASLIYLLRTIGRSRGYGDKVDVTSGGEPLTGYVVTVPRVVGDIGDADTDG